MSAQSERRRAEADADARLVHHVKHDGQTIAPTTDEIADRPLTALGAEPRPFAEIEQAIGGAAIAHLVVEAGDDHVVALPAAAVLGNEPLRHQEQRDPGGSFGQGSVGSADLGEDEMEDVVAEVVVAAGDPHLVAEQPEALAEGTVAFERRARADVAEGEPACGSDRHMVPNAPASLRLGRTCDLASLPRATSRALAMVSIA